MDQAATICKVLWHTTCVHDKQLLKHHVCCTENSCTKFRSCLSSTFTPWVTVITQQKWRRFSTPRGNTFGDVSFPRYQLSKHTHTCTQCIVQSNVYTHYSAPPHTQNKKNDSTTSHAKQLDVVLGVDHMVLVIDDTDTVWPNNKANLMQIARYLFFPHDAVRYSGSAGRSYLERHSDESPDNGALQGCLATLRWVHARFFAAYDKVCAP